MLPRNSVLYLAHETHTRVGSWKVNRPYNTSMRWRRRGGYTPTGHSVTTANESKLGGARGGHRGPIVLTVAAARVLPLLPVCVVVVVPVCVCVCHAVYAVYAITGVAWNVRRVLAKTPSRRHFESKRTSKTGSRSKIGFRNGFVRFGKF